MCFSNLPIEFDDEGNPYLAEEAEKVDQPRDTEYGCEVTLDKTDPEAMYTAILESMPSDVREQVDDPGDSGSSGGRLGGATEHGRQEIGESD